MLSSLFRPGKNRQRSPSVFSSPELPFAEQDDDFGSAAEGHEDANGDGDNESERSPLLPIFASDLDLIAVYNMVREIREQICATVDTTLTYDQLRTPQVSSFVVKPILSNLLDMAGRKGILYSLMANCLQFRKEMEETPFNVGTSKTRALLCELLATKMLKEFSTRELIDALSYDFYPLQGISPLNVPPVPRKVGLYSVKTTSRISALEIAIRAQAKKFLSHPLVVRHLEAIWAGKIVFHSAYDQMHKIRDDGRPMSNGSDGPFRRSATIYDGRYASLFKLSRLRIPRYRHIFSTLSLAILLSLHLKVLIERSYTITPLEIVFWLWSFGFMVDEIADFNESGVSLYFASMWNVFDFSIFILFMTFYALRMAGKFMGNDRITAWSFDILASCSIFLFPRIFSVLDHYQYFSQLIVAFRIMAADMVALLVLIVVSCSGFFVAFTFSFAREYSSAADVSYSLFQILMGFTPAAWETWSRYNLLGKLLLTAFLIICHFLIVTILITVLTNTFASVVANSVEEHQFLVAVNTISLVKNEAIFTYLAPSNLLAWILHPLRYFISFRKFVRLNRTVVKITHLPLLAAIYLYECSMLQSSTYAPVDSKKPRPQHITINALKPPREPGEMRGPVMRRLRRRDSISSSHQERALEQVFAKPFKGRTRSDKSDMVDSWVSSMLSTSPPMDDDGLSRGNSTRQHNRSRGIRPGHRGQLGTPQHARLPRRDFSMSRSARSDPEDFASGAYKEPLSEADDDDINTVDDDADNEENNEENSADEAETNADSVREAPHATTLRLRGFPKTSALTGPSSVFDSSPQLTRDTLAALQPPPPPRRPLPSNFHERNESTNTILFSPIKHKPVSEDDSPSSRKKGNGGYSDRKPPGARPRPIIGDTRQATDLTALADLADDNEANFRMLPSSFATQMAMANSVESGMNKLMLAKIGALEEGIKDIKDILGDVKKMRKREAKLSREA